MKVTVIIELLPDGQISVTRAWDSPPVDLGERANAVHALRMFANATETTPISDWHQAVPPKASGSQKIPASNRPANWAAKKRKPLAQKAKRRAN